MSHPSAGTGDTPQEALDDHLPDPSAVDGLEVIVGDVAPEAPDGPTTVDVELYYADQPAEKLSVDIVPVDGRWEAYLRSRRRL